MNFEPDIVQGAIVPCHPNNMPHDKTTILPDMTLPAQPHFRPRGNYVIFITVLYPINIIRKEFMRAALLVVFMFISGYSLAETQDKTSQCLEELKKDSRFSSIAGHLALDGQDVTKPLMLTDKSKPNEQQKQAIADWIDARSLCVNLSLIKVSVDLHMLFLSTVPELYNGQTTFGEFNNKWRTLFKETIELPASYEKPAAHHHH